jgi:tRNA(Ser,Leu) C12 N-acetylase TAN1
MNPRDIEEQAMARRQYEIEVCEMALNHHGVTTQTIKTIEELAELQVELAKTVNLNHRKTMFIDELVDVELMLTQIKLAYFPTYEDIKEFNDHKRVKLERLKSRIEADIERIQNTDESNTSK